MALFLSRTRQRGFTIYEAIITLAIGSALAVGSIGITSAIEETAVTTSANLLVTHLQRSRSEAIKRRTKITMCPSVDQAQCARFDANYTSWRTGWLVYADANDNKQVDPGELIGVHTMDLGRFTVRSSRARKQVTYHSSGTAGGSTITFALCHENNPKLSRYVVVSNTGRPRIAKTNTSELRCT